MQRRVGEAEEGMRAMLKLDPENPCALPNLAHLLLRRGAVTDALAVYRRLGKVGPEARKRMAVDHDALCFGLALRAAGQEAEAISVMQAAAEAMRARGRTAGRAGRSGHRAALLAGRVARSRPLPSSPGWRGTGEPRGDVAAWLARAPRGARRARPRHAPLRARRPHGLRRPYYVLIDPSLASVRDRPEIDRLLPTRGVPSS